MKGRNYRIGKGRSYVRKEYIGGGPVSKINKFTMGNPKGNFQYRLTLIPLKKVQIRHNAIEASRIATNKILFDKFGETGYFLRMRLYPHIILRENKMMAFAGADRVQEGMRRSFGKPVSLAAKVKPGQPIMEVFVNEEGIETAKHSLLLGANKLPTTSTIEMETIKKSS